MVLVRISLIEPNRGFLLTQTVAIVAVIVWQLDLQLPMQPVPITTEFVSSNPAQARCTRYNKHYVIKFVSDLGQISGLLQLSSTNKTDRIDITEILLKVALNTITLTLCHTSVNVTITRFL